MYAASAVLTSWNTKFSQDLVLVLIEEIALINWPLKKAFRASQNTPEATESLLICIKVVRVCSIGSGNWESQNGFLFQ